MSEAKSTYIKGNQVGHMYMLGKEVKKAYYLGNIFYQIEQGGLKRTLLPDGVTGTGLITIGDKTILYGDYDYVNGIAKFHILQNGEYVRTDLKSFASATSISYIPYHDEEFLLMYVSTNNGTTMHTYGINGLSSGIDVPGNVYRGGIYKSNTLICSNIAQYYPQFSDNGQWWQIPEDMRANYEHFPNILQTVKFGAEYPIEIKEYVRYAIPIDVEIVNDVEYEFDNPIIYCLTKDSATERLYGLVATKFKKDVFDYYLYIGNYEITDIEEGNITLGRAINEPQWAKPQIYRGIDNCGSKVLQEYRRYGNYTIEKGSVNIGNGSSTGIQSGYAIKDFDSFANYVLRKTSNDNGYRAEDWVVHFDATMTGYYDGKYWKINPKDIYIKGMYEWNTGIFNSSNAELWYFQDLVDYRISEIGSAYDNVRCAWGDDGINLHVLNRTFDPTIPGFIEKNYIYHYSN